MKIIDKYILSRYLSTFFVMLFMFIPIGIVIDVSEKVNKMIANKVPIEEILIYYANFTIHFANLLFPIFLFLSVIWFTSKLANNTEIIAILSSGISFNRFLKPYIIGATIVAFLAILMGFFLVPRASKGFNDFRYNYLKENNQTRETNDIYRQIKKENNSNEYIYVSNYNYMSKTGFNFVFEKCIDNKLIYKVSANRIKYNDESNDYTLYNYRKRTIGKINDDLETLDKKIVKYNFEPDDLTPVYYVAETMSLTEIYEFINKEKERGNSNINAYLVVLYKKYSLPVSAFILTIIAVAVSAMKRRGGMGVNLAIGIIIAFTFIFFDKVFGTIAEKSSFSPLLAVWIPNIVFGIMAIYLLRNAKR